ncbi:acyltransferase family protein [Teredinibacter turnerae]|uniref:acyltransferase family protein n=1 Tax=Teredinibacter turnerae TaxID=2426 RepID=UPI0030CD3120
MQAKRDDSFDCLKGVLISLVVYGHVTYVGGYRVYLEALSDVIYLFHMPLFFTLSGVFFKPLLGRQRVKSFISRLALPYILFYGLYLAILQLAGRYSSIEISNSFEGDWISALFVWPLASYWYLHSLIYFVFLMSVAWITLSRFNFSGVFLALGSALLVVVVTWCLVVIGFRLYLWVVFYLLAGFFLSNQIRTVKVGQSFAFIAIILIVILAAFMPSQTDVEVFRIWQCFLIVCLVVAFLGLRDFFVSSWVAFLGRNSLLILLFHVYFLNLLKPTQSLFLSLDASGILYAVASSISGVWGGILTGIALDRLKIYPSLFKCRALQ